jgi:DNA end-binding protein Ku
MIDLATHIIDTMAGHFDPQRFEDRYKVAMSEVIRRKQAGEKIIPVDHAKPMTIKLMDALRASLGQRPPAASSVRRRSAVRPRRASARNQLKRNAGRAMAFPVTRSLYSGHPKNDCHQGDSAQATLCFEPRTGLRALQARTAL